MTPEKIYLQIGDDIDPSDDITLSEVSWWHKKIFENDQEYIRSDIHEKEVNYWKERCKAAERYIDETPCDPDILSDWFVTYQHWQTLKNQENETD